MFGNAAVGDIDQCAFNDVLTACIAVYQTYVQHYPDGIAVFAPKPHLMIGNNFLGFDSFHEGGPFGGLEIQVRRRGGEESMGRVKTKHVSGGGIALQNASSKSCTKDTCQVPLKQETIALF